MFTYQTQAAGWSCTTLRPQGAQVPDCGTRQVPSVLMCILLHGPSYSSRHLPSSPCEPATAGWSMGHIPDSGHWIVTYQTRLQGGHVPDSGCRVVTYQTQSRGGHVCTTHSGRPRCGHVPEGARREQRERLVEVGPVGGRVGGVGREVDGAGVDVRAAADVGHNG